MALIALHLALLIVFSLNVPSPYIVVVVIIIALFVAFWQEISVVLFSTKRAIFTP